MRRKACGLLVLMLAGASVTACKTGKETAEENIAWETKNSADAQENEAGEAEVGAAGETDGGAGTSSGAPDGASQAGTGISQTGESQPASQDNTAAAPGLDGGDGSAAPAPDRQNPPLSAAGQSTMMKKYQEVLSGVFYDQVYPDGSSCDYDNYSSITINQFAVYDVDGDGQDELIIQFSTSSMAGMTESVYRYNAAADSVELELSEFPGAAYYDNGLALVGWSHNQGLAGDFWPYNVYQYNPETDEYEAVFSVDAWDRELADTDYDGNPYPADVDVNNDGIVFYIMPGGSYDTDHPVSLREYKSWYDSILGGASELEVPFQDLTEDNIRGVQ